MEIAVAVAVGFGVALVCTPAGVSGAFLLLPVQVLLLGAPSPTVSATNLLFNVVATPAGIAGLRRRHPLDRRLTRLLLAGSVPGVVVGVAVRSTLLASASAFAPIAAAVLVVLGAQLLLGPRQDPSDDSARADSWVTVRIVSVSVAAGAIGAIYGIGGAALLVPWLVGIERIALARAATCGLVLTFVTSVIGVTAYVTAGALGVGEATAPDWTLGLALGVGGAMGATAGAAVAPWLPTGLLRGVLATAAVVAGVRLLLMA